MTKAQTILKSAPLYTDGVDYRLVQLPPNGITAAAAILAELGAAFSAVLVDKDEVTLVLPHQAIESFSKRLIDAQITEAYHLLTFDVALPADLTGFMAQAAQLLAAAAIPIIPIGAYSRDHLLIPASHFEAARQVLEAYQTT